MSGRPPSYRFALRTSVLYEVRPVDLWGRCALKQTIVLILLTILAACVVTDDVGETENIGVSRQHLYLNPLVPVTVTITSVDALDLFDSPIDPFNIDADFYAYITINGERQRFGPIDNEDHITPNWTHTVNVPITTGRVRVSIEIWDYDGFLTSQDDQGDPSPDFGRTLDLGLDLATGHWGRSREG